MINRPIWNPSTCKCECGKLCDFVGYLDYVDCNCRKILIDRLALDCEGDILIKSETSFYDKKVTFKKK